MSYEWWFWNNTRIRNLDVQILISDQNRGEPLETHTVAMGYVTDSGLNPNLDQSRLGVGAGPWISFFVSWYSPSRGSLTQREIERTPGPCSPHLMVSNFSCPGLTFCWGPIHTGRAMRRKGNGTYWCEWECPHCTQTTSKEKFSNLHVHRVARPVWIGPEAPWEKDLTPRGWVSFSHKNVNLCKTHWKF